MKSIPPTTIALLALFLASCGKPTADVPSSSEPAPTPVAPAASSQSAANGRTAVPVPTATPAHELAPAGIFYLLASVRIETESGITGLPPGTGVKLLHDDLYLTPAGEAHLDAAQMTNDMTIARAAMNADRSAQAATQKVLSAQAAAAHALQAAAAQGSTAAPGAPVDMANVRTRIAELEAQREGLNSKLSVLREKQSGEQFRADVRRHIIASSTVEQEKAVIDEITEINIEIARLNQMH